jgi:Fe-S cluster biogenesis protein NfuA
VSYEYNNIDEAKNSKLVQKLFYLPFVNKVYLTPSFISIERFNIVEWAEVENEVKGLIEDYLNDKLDVISENKIARVNPISIYTESTPNPSVLKFVSSKLIINESLEFNNIDEAKGVDFVKRLFGFPFVKSVYLSKNFISITKYDIKDWGEITSELRIFIKNYLENNKIEINKVQKNQTEIKLDNTSKEIISILDEYIKPAVSSDGGNILFESYNPKKKLVKVILQGACSGCPSSTITLKNGIENMLKEMLSGKVEVVEAING